MASSTNAPNSDDRPYHIVVWGATGFTGRLVCEHLARDYQGKVRWAMAGRDPRKLEAVRSELAAINPLCKDVPLLTADANDAPSVGSVLRQGRVVLATVGPFARYGDKVLEQAVAQGTHYCDITGEVAWVKRSIKRHHAAAEAKGVRLLHCCGYDSVPSDMGTFMMVQYCKEKLGRDVSQSYSLVGPGSGGISGGTIASIIDIVRNEPLSELRAMSGDQYYLARECGGKGGSDRPAAMLPTYVAPAGTWTGPFLMEGVNAKVVQLSAALRAGMGQPYGSDFKYCERLAIGGLMGAASATAFLMGAGAVMGLSPLRAIATRFLPAPGQGPAEAARKGGRWRHELYAETEGPEPLLVKGVCGDQRDPGYWSTSRMLLETGLCMALDDAKLAAAPGLRRGGVLTPASACGPVLLERLRGAGFTFEVEGVVSKGDHGQGAEAGKRAEAEVSVAAGQKR